MSRFLQLDRKVACKNKRLDQRLSTLHICKGAVPYDQKERNNTVHSLFSQQAPVKCLVLY